MFFGSCARAEGEKGKRRSDIACHERRMREGSSGPDVLVDGRRVLDIVVCGQAFDVEDDGGGEGRRDELDTDFADHKKA